MDRLRPACTDDLPAMLAWRNHPDVRKMMYTRHVITTDEHSAWWDAQSGRTDRSVLIYEINDMPAGVVSFSGIDKVNRRADWAFYAALPAPRGTGHRMEALALEHAFESLRLHKLGCEVLAFNRRVITLHRSFGFRIEGILRDHILFPEGFATVVRLAIFEHRWRENSQKPALKETP